MRFVAGFASIAARLQCLLWKDVDFLWSENYKVAFVNGLCVTIAKWFDVLW